MAVADRQLADVIGREQSRLRRFIRRRLPDPADVEDVLQDVFLRLVEANRLLMPIEHVTAWLLRVARNRIVDLVRKRTPARFSDLLDDEDAESLADLLPSRDPGPEAAYANQLLIDEIAAALDELPREQRDVFVAHEIDGRSFKQIARETGVNVNTLLARKRYAVLRLRARLQGIYDDLETRS